MTGHALVDMISQNGEKLCVKLMNKTMYSLPSNYIRVAIWKTPIYIKIVGNIFPLHVKLCDSSFRQLYIVFFFPYLDVKMTSGLSCCIVQGIFRARHIPH